MSQTQTKAQTGVATVVKVALVGLAGAGMLAFGGLGFMETEITPSIKNANNFTGWQWSFDNSDNYQFQSDKIKLENNSVRLQANQDIGTISNKSNIAQGCYPHPAIEFWTNPNNEISFQISKDNTNWYYWKDNLWHNAQDLTQSNSADEINKNINVFYPKSLEQFYFKAIFDSPNQQLDTVSINCDVSTLDKILLYPESI